MAAAVSAEPYDRCDDAALQLSCSPTSVVDVLLVTDDETLLRDDDDDAKIVLIPKDSVADDVT